MDGDFQAHYLTAEQAYGAGDFRTAQSIVVDLLRQLDGMAENNAEQDALLAWRAFVALLAGNIHLYGLNEPDRASWFYELVLSSNPQDTLKDLAEQGLERIQDEKGRVPEALAPPSASTLIQDPFLAQPTTSGSGLDPEQSASSAAATPWLDNSAAAQAPITTASTAVAETDAEPSAAIKVAARPEPENLIEAEVIPQHLPEPEPEILVSPSIRQRLEQGRLQITLPTQQKPPSETNSNSGGKSRRWSWLQALLGGG